MKGPPTVRCAHLLNDLRSTPFVVDAAPFRALRYDPLVAGDPVATSAPAYDDVERFTYARHRAASPYTVLELLAGTDDGEAPYGAASASFRRWQRLGVLVADAAAAFYLYEIHELRQGVPAVLRGVLASVAVGDGGLLPHEDVDDGRVDERARRLDAVPAELAPVFAVHEPAPAAYRAVIDADPDTPPIEAFTDEAGADHRVWAIRDPEAIATITCGLRDVRAVIADGHHRAAAAALRAARRGEAGRTLTYLVDGGAYGPQLQAIHRLVRPVAGDLSDTLLADFSVTAVSVEHLEDALAHAPPASFGVVTAEGSSLLCPRDAASLRAAGGGNHGEVWRRLDSAVWETAVLPALGGVEVRYRADVAAALAEVATVGDTALFVLRPPALADVYACAEAGEPMPPKTTWFRPKPRAGLVMRSLESGA